MPGMMDTVLNLGLNDEVVEGLAAKAGARFAYDSYRRFLDMFGNVVMGVPHEAFEHEISAMKLSIVINRICVIEEIYRASSRPDGRSCLGFRGAIENPLHVCTRASSFHAAALLKSALNNPQLDIAAHLTAGYDSNIRGHNYEILIMSSDRGVEEDTGLSAEDLKELVGRYKAVYASQGVSFPQDPLEQLRRGIYAVFDSWMSERANVYRRINKITGLKGTAVNVQAMAYGNLGDTSGTG
eukprot:scaffold68194_cov32-Prasinocladus_malaysianus.AAC.1